jgi:hypothetical protein
MNHASSSEPSGMGMRWPTQHYHRIHGNFILWCTTRYVLEGQTLFRYKSGLVNYPSTTDVSVGSLGEDDNHSNKVSFRRVKQQFER